MGKQLALVIALVSVIGVAAFIAFEIGTRSEAGTTVSKTTALSDVDFKVSDPDAEQLAGPSESEPKQVSADADQSSGPVEGIEVHGQWTIEVEEEDGRFVSLREFDNALVGGVSLAELLAHEHQIGSWFFQLAGSGAGEPCNDNQGVDRACQSWEQTTGGATGLAQNFSDLLVEVPDSGVNADKLVLSGSITIANTTQIISVGTHYLKCNTSTSPVDALACSGPAATITHTNPSPWIDVQAGQVVNVTVVISFS